VQIAILTMPFYFIHAGLRSLVDAGAIKAYNTRNILIALAAFLLTSGAAIFARGFHFLEILAVCGMFGLLVLSILTWLTTKKLFDVHPSWKKIFPGLALAIALGGLSYLVRRFFPTHLGLPMVAAVEILVCLLYALALYWMRIPWFTFVRTTALPGFSRK
jgi:hypothetical protein